MAVPCAPALARGKRNSAAALNFNSHVSYNPAPDIELDDDPDSPFAPPMAPKAPTTPSSRRPQLRKQQGGLERIPMADPADQSGRPDELQRTPTKDSLDQFKESEVHREDLTLEDCVGSGVTAEVYRGMWKGQIVAIKQYQSSSRRCAQLKQEVAFLRETGVASRISHKNLVKLHGWAFDKHPYLLISEFCSGGNAFVLLHESDLELGMMQKLKMICDLACAMEYLHAFEPQIIHRDLKSLNLLLDVPVDTQDDVPHVKVADFGLAKMKELDTYGWGKMTCEAGTFHWMAPEVASGHYNEKADIYSFAMVLFEILCQEVPFDELDADEVVAHARNGERPNLGAVPSACPDGLAILLQKCWSGVPSERPAFHDICVDIDKICSKFKWKGVLLSARNRKSVSF